MNLFSENSSPELPKLNSGWCAAAATIKAVAPASIDTLAVACCEPVLRHGAGAGAGATRPPGITAP
eukprot:COSAG05_NODE_10_length_39559_cov_64.255423_9_plen_66_part_00